MAGIRAPILMYHKVGAEDRFLNVSADSFARQVRLLKRLGFQGVTQSEAVDGIFAGAKLPPKPVCITFDDGYVNIMDHAYPILKTAGWPGTVFVPTAYVGSGNSWDEPLGNPVLPIMDWAQFGTLSDLGWDIAGHTRNHPRLAQLDDGEALQEMRDGKSDIESNLGVRVRAFCYPFGSLKERTVVLCREAGFESACTTQSGLASSSADRFLLPRVKVAYSDGVLGLLYRLFVRPHLP